MIYILVVWLYGISLVVLPTTFPSLDQCERSGEAFLTQAESKKAKTPGFACIPIELVD